MKFWKKNYPLIVYDLKTIFLSIYALFLIEKSVGITHPFGKRPSGAYGCVFVRVITYR